MFEGAWVNESSNENVPENRTVEEDGRSPVAPDEGKPPTKLYRAEKERVDDWESRKLTEPSLKRTTGYVNDEALRCLERQRCFRNPSLGTNHLGEKYIKTPVLFSNPGIKLVGFIFGGGKPVAKPTKSGGRRLNQCIKPGIS
ncbi:hypothetical protein V6N11_058369 [Hibiscus sabdariffa]|uniref:Uncharacterized protein n=1 Tax=Hibiscus sabdariffa TaxID=183260 RepID=A0ABR2U4D0_9ROSI